MGQIKNIKLHIVTDIKDIKSKQIDDLITVGLPSCIPRLNV